MRLRLLLAVFMLVLTGCSAKPLPAPSQAVNGNLDLSNWNFVQNGPVTLSGEWAFYWDKLYTPEDIKASHPHPVWAQVPKMWNDYKIGGKSLPGTGFATYHLHVHVKNQNQSLAMKIPYAYTAYKLWVNGKVAAKNGTVGSDASSSKPQFYNQIVAFRGDADIIIQVSNFQFRQGGLFQALTLGTTGQIVRSQNLREAVEMFLFGGLFTIGVYYLILFRFRRHVLYHLYFGLICILLSLHSLCEDEVMLTQFFPHFPWVIALKLEYITADISKILLFPLFFQSLFSGLLHKRVMAITVSLSFLFFMTALMTPASFFTNYYYFAIIADVLLMVYLWFMLIKAIREKREGSFVTFFFFTVFICTVFNDILFSFGWLRTGDYLEWGIDFYIFGQALILSMKFSKSFTLAEKLSKELKKLNQTLEEKVQNRTQRLQQSNGILKETNEQLNKKNKQIQEYENSRRHLLANISHELRTPITLIQGYLEALIYDIIIKKGERKQHLVQIHSKTLQLNQLIEDLFELSRLEIKQSSFKMNPVVVRAWVEGIFDRFSTDVEQNQLRFASENHLSPNDESCWLIMDKARMDQVLSNLVFNAIKFTPKDGTITMTVDVETASQHFDKASDGIKKRLRIQIRDNGSGIPESDLPQIFERFYKAKKAPNKQQGTGLGLAISKAIVEHHQGKIGAESKEREGSTFYFTLPLFETKPN